MPIGWEKCQLDPTFRKGNQETPLIFLGCKNHGVFVAGDSIRDPFWDGDLWRDPFFRGYIFRDLQGSGDEMVTAWITWVVEIQGHLLLWRYDWTPKHRTSGSYDWMST